MSIEFEYNGEKIICPDMPSEYLEVLPYYSIFVVTVASQTYCMAIMTQNEMFFAPEALAQQGLGLSSSTICSFGAGYLYSFLVANEWDPFKEKSAGFCLHNVFDYEITNWDVVWSNHDILELTGVDDNGDPTSNGTIYFTSSVTTAEPFILPDGTELPALPEGCFEKYPYGMIVRNENASPSDYQLYVFEVPGVYVPSELNGAGYEFVDIDGKCASANLNLSQGDTDWSEVTYNKFASAQIIVGELADFGLSIAAVWSNHDILTATACEENDDGSFHPTEIGPDLYHRSDVNYRIYGGWLNSMGNQARRLGNVSGALKPGEMETVFSGATLEPLTVTPTSEAQTFTPESPCIGFSVVTVEAAPDTGGGEVIVPEYPSAENVTFGNVSTEAIEYTGKYFYGTYQTALPPIPEVSDTYKYWALILDSTGVVQLRGLSCPFVITSTGAIKGNASGSRVGYYVNKITNDAWPTTPNNQGNSTSVVSLGTVYWSNEDITYQDSGEVFLAGSDLVPETTKTIVLTPADRDEMYLISGATLNALMGAAQGTLGTTDLLTPSGAADALNEQLNDTTT